MLDEKDSYRFSATNHKKKFLIILLEVKTMENS